MLNIISHRQLLSNVQFLVTPWTGPARIPYPWNSLGKHTGVGSHFLLQRIFLSQGSNPSPQLQADSFLFFFFLLLFFFQLYHFIATNPSPSTLVHTCSVMSSHGLQPTRLLRMDFSRQEYWNGLPFPSPAGRFFTF